MIEKLRVLPVGREWETFYFSKSCGGIPFLLSQRLTLKFTDSNGG